MYALEFYLMGQQHLQKTGRSARKALFATDLPARRHWNRDDMEEGTQYE